MEMKSSKHKNIRQYVAGTLWELKDKRSRSHMKKMKMTNKKASLGWKNTNTPTAHDNEEKRSKGICFLKEILEYTS